MKISGIGLITLLVFSGCTINPGDASISIDAKAWYNSREIRVPVSTDGRIRYVEWVYEYDAGDGWVTDQEGTMFLPSDDRGLLEFSATEPGWNHRIRLSGLGSASVGQPAQEVTAKEHYFQIDTTSPSADPGFLNLTAYQPYPTAVTTYFAADTLELGIHHTEFDAPSGSPVRVYLTGESRPPLKDDEFRDESDQERITIWETVSVGFEQQVRLIVIDAAGNRSAVRVVSFVAE